MPKYSVAVVGLGFVGLSTAACFAELGAKVLGVDIDRKKIATIEKGVLSFYEPGLKPILKKVIKDGSFTVSSNIRLVAQAPIIFIVVGTPSKEDGSMEDRFLLSVSRQIGAGIKGSNSYHLIVVKSTGIPGTSLKLVVPEIGKASGLKYGEGFGACSNPEFLREGSAIEDTLNPDRIIIGGRPKDTEMLKTFYKKIYGKKLPKVICTNPTNAELIKYANNAFLAMKISFINQIARVCEMLPESDITVISDGIGLDKRINPLFLRAGLGFGGSCFPKDVKAFIEFSKKLGYRPLLAEATMKINEDQAISAVKMAEGKLGNLEGKKIALLGLAFKPDTDDMREAVSITIVEELLKRKAKVFAHDPKAHNTAATIFSGKISLEKNAKACLKDADCAILVTEWKEYAALRPNAFTKLMKNPVLIDGRRLFNAYEFSKHLDFAAVGLGARI